MRILSPCLNRALRFMPMPTTTAESAVITEDRPLVLSLTAATAAAVERVCQQRRRRARSLRRIGRPRLRWPRPPPPPLRDCYCVLLLYCNEIDAHPTLAFYFIFRKENAIMENNSQTRKKCSIEDCVRMVQMGLTPYEALRECNHPCRRQKLSYELNLCTMNVHARNAAK